MSSSTKSKLAVAKTVVSTIGSVAAATMVARSIAREYLPSEFQDYLYFGFRNFINKLSQQLTMVIYEFDGFQENEIYNATEIYLGSRLSPEINRLKITKISNEKNINVAMEMNGEFVDIYNGVKFKWCLVSKKLPTREYHNYDEINGSSTITDQRTLELTFHQKHKDLALNEYLPFIINNSKTKKQEEKTVKLFTVDTYQRSAVWTPVNLDHPATFATLAMDTDLKETVMKDLDRFLQRREYYRRVGKAWKRGYLLYGPPGTGKSSLIAAMANYLKFDIYDLELTDIRSNCDLRRLLVATRNRSILVVEDIDCSVELHDRADGKVVKPLVQESNHRRGPHGYDVEYGITLSGFLNFIDGLWSSCGDERIIIFTTNRKEKLDPALLRPGRMDIHVNMSYCTPSGFRLLASNYLGITQHDLFEDIEDSIREVEITPAEVAEQLLKEDDPDIALDGLVEFLDVKRKESQEAKEKEKREKESATKESDDQQIEKTEIVVESLNGELLG